MINIALFAGLMIMSVAINAFCVQVANRKAIGIEMSYGKSFLVVALRTAAALTAGLGIGLLVTGYEKQQTVSIGVAEVLVTTAVLAMSFFIYQVLISRFTGKKVSVIELLKSIFMEIWILAIITVFGGFGLALILWLIGRFI